MIQYNRKCDDNPYFLLLVLCQAKLYLVTIQFFYKSVNLIKVYINNNVFLQFKIIKRC